MVAVTVLMSAYNAEDFLQEALDSVFCQSFGDFELLVVDDGSTDRTGEILRRQTDSRLRILANEHNMGLSRSLNRGLAEARGRYVARLDADDIAEPERLSRQVAWLDSHLDTLLLGSSYYEIAESGERIKLERLPCDYIAICWSLLFFSPFVHSALMFRRAELLERIGNYDEALHYSMDYDLCYRAAIHARVENLAEPLVRIRSQGSSMTATYGSKAEEGYRIRIARVGHLLGWSPARTDDLTRLFDDLFAFLRSEEPSLQPTSLQGVYRELMKLHVAFCRHFELSEQTCAGHRKELFRWAARRFRWFAVGHADRGAWRAAVSIFTFAVRTDPRVLFDRGNFNWLVGARRRHPSATIPLDPE